jgi:hypothetical protein
VKFINTTFDKELKYINGVLYRLNWVSFCAKFMS